MARATYPGYRQSSHRFKWVMLWLELIGCRGDGWAPSLADTHAIRPGSFRIVLQGEVTDTLEGLARFRQDASGTIVVDLIGWPDTGRGLSLELSSTQADTLEAVRRWIAGPVQDAFAVGYLAWSPHTFVSEAGKLVLRERGRSDRLTGTLELIMGAVDLQTGEPLELEAMGAFVALPTSKK